MKPKKAQPKAVPTPPKKQAAQAEPTTPNRRPTAYIVLLAAGVFLFGASLALVMLGTFDALEQRIFNLINHAYLSDWVGQQIAKPISNAVWGMVALVAVLLLFPKYRLLSWQYAVAGGAAYVAVFVTEHLVDRARPIALAGYEVVARAMQGGPGFPSGHVAVLTAIGLTVWPLVSWPWRAFILLLIVAEAWSRIFLGVHAPLDVVGGVAVAMMVVGVIHITPGKIRRFFRLSA